MEVTEAVANVLEFIDRLNCSGHTDGQHLLASTESRGHKRHREVDICGDDSERAVSSGYVEQLDSQPLRWLYVQRARKRAAGTAGASTEPAVGAAAGDNVLVGSSSVRAAAGTAALIGNASAGAAQTAIEVTAAVAAGSTAVLVAGAEITTIGSSSGRAAAAAAAALMGHAAARVTVEATRPVEKLSRQQAKNLRQRLKK